MMKWSVNVGGLDAYSELRWYPAKKGAGNDWSKAKEFHG